MQPTYHQDTLSYIFPKPLSSSYAWLNGKIFLEHKTSSNIWNQWIIIMREKEKCLSLFIERKWEKNVLEKSKTCFPDYTWKDNAQHFYIRLFHQLILDGKEKVEDRPWLYTFQNHFDLKVFPNKKIISPEANLIFLIKIYSDQQTISQNKIFKYLT